ncbi:MAG TPA: hypothetical protein VNJ10_07405 [Sphingomonas sp.]|nr:hypothetical protein [Sphingomonas sp.]
MDGRKAETLYLSGRAADSLARAAAAASPCAQIAHLTLARLYGEAIDALVTRPRNAPLHSRQSVASQL